nr:DHHA1 domain-containing protein [Sedimentibacter sp.]
MNSSEKVYQQNSYLTTLQSEVLSCVKNDNRYQVILDRTIFYPHMSGGQPKDEGTINGIKVLDVIETVNDIIHVVQEPLSGTVSLSIDFKTRFDYMQQHTGQHMLSYAFASLYNANTIGFHLGDDYTTIDLDINPSSEMIENVEILANQNIYSNRNIIFHNLPYDEVLKLNMRKAPPKLDFLRIMEIEGNDTVACGGTHVKSTGEVGIIKIIKSEKYKSGSRIEFLCGKRALNDYMSKHDNIINLSASLSCKSNMIIDNLNKIFNENKCLKKNMISLQNELNEFKAKELQNLATSKNNVNFIIEKYQHNNIDIKELRYICSKSVEGNNKVTFLIYEDDTTCSIVLGQSDNLNFDIKNIFEKCKSLLNIKGGGNNKLIQGTGTVLNKSDECLSLVKRLLLI